MRPTAICLFLLFALPFADPLACAIEAKLTFIPRDDGSAAMSLVTAKRSLAHSAQQTTRLFAGMRAEISSA